MCTGYGTLQGLPPNSFGVSFASFWLFCLKGSLQSPLPPSGVLEATLESFLQDYSSLLLSNYGFYHKLSQLPQNLINRWNSACAYWLSIYNYHRHRIPEEYCSYGGDYRSVEFQDIL